MTRLAFWAAAALVAYAYAIFPVLVIVRGLLRPRPYRSEPITPTVSLLIAARNEEAVIARRLENLLELDYPSDLLDVVIASDGSTDATNEILRGYVRPGIQVLERPPLGKGQALGSAVAASRGEIIVFSDANSMYAPGAIRALVAPFADPAVGGVAGNQVYGGGTEVAAEAGERTYWGLDRLLKRFESRAGDTIAATGAIYAIRRSLVRPIPPGVNDDFYLSLGVVDQGFRLVFAEDAIAYEPPADAFDREYRRKVRIVTRAMTCIRSMPSLLDPRRHGFYALQLLSHKVLRWLMAIPLAVLALTSARLARRGPVYAIAAAGQAVCYALAVAGYRSVRRGGAPRRLMAVPLYFCMVNLAAVKAALNVLSGTRIDRWEVVARPSPTPIARTANVHDADDRADAGAS